MSTPFPTAHPTTVITERIRDFHQGRIGEQELVEFLDKHRYTSAEDPDEPEKGTAASHLYFADGGRPYVPGSWGEVRLCRSVGWLPTDIYLHVNRLAYERARASMTSSGSAPHPSDADGAAPAH